MHVFVDVVWRKIHKHETAGVFYSVREAGEVITKSCHPHIVGKKSSPQAITKCSVQAMYMICEVLKIEVVHSHVYIQLIIVCELQL